MEAEQKARDEDFASQQKGLAMQAQAEAEAERWLAKRREGIAALKAGAADEQAVLGLRLSGNEREAAALERKQKLEAQIVALRRSGVSDPELEAQMRKSAALREQLIDQKETAKAAEKAADDAEKEAKSRERAADAAERAKRALEDLRGDFTDVGAKGSKGIAARKEAREKFERELARGGATPEEAAAKRAQFDHDMRRARGRFGGPAGVADPSRNIGAPDADAFRKRFPKAGPAPGPAPEAAQLDGAAADIASAVPGIGSLSAALDSVAAVLAQLAANDVVMAQAVAKAQKDIATTQSMLGK
ncbi:MAG: hypothetical protein ABMA13_12345 [Chthoniobacteraceae bacterium]